MKSNRPHLQIIDIFPEFLSFWQQVHSLSFTEQIERWDTVYMQPWPELRQKQIACYADEGDDWLSMAREHVFPFLSERSASMHVAHENLLGICADVYGRCQQTLHFDSDLNVVIYVGIGCGAGWATTYEGKRAILFGLENIAEEGWQAREALTGLMAHEVGHLAHFQWRQEAGAANEEGPWWQLYTEGFAQWCEHLVQGQPSWHMQLDKKGQWQRWCRSNLGWLAAEFLRCADKGESLRPFFGSWYDLQGYKQTGYFLGHELIKVMCQQLNLREIALLENVADQLRPLLTEIAV